MAEELPIATFDGIGIRVRGDLVTVVYGADARLDRTRWLFDRLDAAASAHPDGIVTHLVVLPDSGPPDGPTRDENTKRLRKLGARMRCLVTTPLGTGLQVSIVRTIMRGLAILNGRNNHFIANTVDDGAARCREGASKQTPNVSAMKEDVGAIMLALNKPKVAA